MVWAFGLLAAGGCGKPSRPVGGALVYSVRAEDAPDGVMRACAEAVRDPGSTEWQSYLPSADDLQRLGNYQYQMRFSHTEEEVGPEALEHPDRARAALRKACVEKLAFIRAVLAAGAVEVGGSQVRGVLDGEPWRTRLATAGWRWPSVPSVVAGLDRDGPEAVELVLRRETQCVVLGHLAEFYPVKVVTGMVQASAESATIACLDEPALRGWVEYGSVATADAAMGGAASNHGVMSLRELDAAAEANRAVSSVRCVFVFERQGVMKLKSQGPSAYLLTAEFAVTGPPPSPSALLHWFGVANPWMEDPFEADELARAAAGKTVEWKPGSARFRTVERLCVTRSQKPIDETLVPGLRERPWSAERMEQSRRFAQLRLTRLSMRLVGE